MVELADEIVVFDTQTVVDDGIVVGVVDYDLFAVVLAEVVDFVVKYYVVAEVEAVDNFADAAMFDAVVLVEKKMLAVVEVFAELVVVVELVSELGL